MWKVFTWSLSWLWMGVWPDRDENGIAYPGDTVQGMKAGRPLANGHYGVLWVLKGDLEYLYSHLKLPWFTSAQPCALCEANSDDQSIPWTDFRRDSAEWLRHIWSDEAWRQRYQNNHSIFSLPGVSILTVCPDLMHCKHLGTDMYYYGSVLFVVAFVLPGRGSWGRAG